MRRAVVVCAYTADRWELLQRAIESVEGQDVPCRLTIVIDHNDALLAQARARWPAHDVVPNRFARGLSGARNTGVAVAAGADVVAFLDDDAEAQPGWLRALTAPFDDQRIGLVAGRVEPDWESTQPSWFPAEFLWVVGCSYVGLPDHASDVRNPIGASMAVSAAVFDAVGGFVDGIGRIGRTPLGCEETELAIRAGKNGYRVRYEPNSRVCHHVPASRATVAYFLRRCYAEGVSKARVARSVGTNAALESERTYVTRTLPSGIARSMRERSPGRAAMIVSGCATTGIGYVAGRVASGWQRSRVRHQDWLAPAEEAA